MRCKGFTLVELVIIMLFLGILLAVGMPALTASYDNYKLEGAVDQVTVAIRYAQAMAIKTRLPYTVYFEMATSRYELRSAPGGNTVAHPLTKRDYEVQWDQDGPDGPFKGVSITSADFGGLSELTFDEFGAPVAPGTVTLSYGGRTSTVTVNAIGKITVQ